MVKWKCEGFPRQPNFKGWAVEGSRPECACSGLWCPKKQQRQERATDTKQTFTALARSSKMKMSPWYLEREFFSCEWWALAHVRKAKPIDLIAINSSNIGELCTLWHNSLKIVLAMLQTIRCFKKEMGTDRYSAEIESRGTMVRGVSAILPHASRYWPFLSS